ncbi:MAG: tetratricopeptide repeat protein [Planctomycetota bacterium]
MALRTLILLGLALVACRQPSESRAEREPPPVEKDFTLLLEMARLLPLSNEHARLYSEAWMEILRAAPNEEIRAEARYNLGCAGLRAKRPEVARKWFEEAVASEFACADRGRSGYHLGMMQYTGKEYEAARRNLAIYLDSDPDNLDWMAAAELRRAECLLELGRPEEGRAELERFIASRAVPDGHSAASVNAARRRLTALDKDS